MKIIIAAVFMFCVCMGCANISHTTITYDADGNIISKDEKKYGRVGRQAIGSFSGFGITFSQQKSDAGLLGEALKNATEANLVIAEKLPKGGL